MKYFRHFQRWRENWYFATMLHSDRLASGLQVEWHDWRAHHLQNRKEITTRVYCVRANYHQGLLCEGSFVDVRICCSDHSASDGLGAHRSKSQKLHPTAQYCNVKHFWSFNIVLAWKMVQGSSGCGFSFTFGTESSSGGERGWRYGQCHSSNHSDSDDSNHD